MFLTILVNNFSTRISVFGSEVVEINIGSRL